MAKKQKLPEDLLFIGLGIASMAKDRLDDMTNFLIKETKMAKDKTDLRKKLLSSGKKEYEALMQTVETKMNRAMKDTMKSMKMTTPNKKSNKNRK